MQCRTHADLTGVNTCNQCGDWLCEDCTVEINGRIFCRSCLSQMPGASAPPKAETPHAAAYAVPPGSKRFISWGVLFLFSCVIPIPGLNYMYEGLIKRGLAAMAGFFLLIYAMIQFFIMGVWQIGLLFALTLPVYMLTNIFDGFHIRRRVNAGEVVLDDIDDVLAFIKRYKGVFIALAVVLLALPIVMPLVRGLMASFPIAGGMIGRFLPVVVVLVGIRILFKKPRRSERKRQDNEWKDEE